MINSLKILFCILLSCGLLISCKKKSEEIPPKVEPQCRITHYTFEDGAGDVLGKRAADLIYNAAGNPQQLIVERPYIGNQSAYFLYDKMNRLTDYIAYNDIRFDSTGQPSNVYFYQWIKFGYLDNNPSSLPAFDTTRSINSYSNGQFAPIGGQPFTGTYTYDAQGRVAGYNSNIYNYDANGNLMGEGNYDAGKNFRGRNKILMFLDRNYSINNHITATTYNAEGYPVVFPEKIIQQRHYTRFLRRLTELYTADYTCGDNLNKN